MLKGDKKAADKEIRRLPTDRPAMDSKSNKPQKEVTTPADEAREMAIGLIARALQNQPLDGNNFDEPGVSETLLEIVSAQKIGALLYHVSKSDGAKDAWPEGIRQTLAKTAQADAESEAIRVHETRRVLAALDAERVVPLVLDGTAFAYSLYPKPHLRPRDATDLLVRHATVVAVVRILGALGYRRHPRAPEQRVLHQDTFLREDESGRAHSLNLRWAVSNRPSQIDGLNYAALRQRAVELEALSPCAMSLCREDALLNACHRGIASGDEINLIRLYDIHLLSECATPVEFARFARTALKRQLGVSARNAIAQAQTWFQTTLPFGTLEDHFPKAKLLEEGRAGRGAVPGWRQIHTLIYDVRFFENLRHGLAWVSEHALPATVRKQDPDVPQSSHWMPAINLRRGLKGVAALLRRSN